MPRSQMASSRMARVRVLRRSESRTSPAARRTSALPEMEVSGVRRSWRWSEQVGAGLLVAGAHGGLLALGERTQAICRESGEAARRAPELEVVVRHPLGRHQPHHADGRLAASDREVEARGRREGRGRGTRRGAVGKGAHGNRALLDHAGSGRERVGARRRERGAPPGRVAYHASERPSPVASAAMTPATASRSGQPWSLPLRSSSACVRARAASASRAWRRRRAARWPATSARQTSPQRCPASRGRARRARAWARRRRS